MQLHLLGTAAAEGWPAPFCRCPNCEEARRRGGPNIRTRSGALVDDDLKIDFCPDTVVHMQRTGRVLTDVRTLLFTHQHSDHIIREELAWVTPPFTQTPPREPIDVCGNQQVLDLARAQLRDMPVLAKHLALHLLEPLRPLTVAAGDTILPLPADHVEGACVLRVTRPPARGGKTLFYGHDSGLYPEATLAALAKGPPIDIALFDCTNGGLKTNNRGHMGVDGVVQMARALRDRGALAPAAQLVATHFSHNGGLLHEDLVREFLPHGIMVAYDGMTVKA